jgi:hypothetical protein
MAATTEESGTDDDGGATLGGGSAPAADVRRAGAGDGGDNAGGRAAWTTGTLPPLMTMTTTTMESLASQTDGCCWSRMVRNNCHEVESSLLMMQPWTWSGRFLATLGKRLVRSSATKGKENVTGSGRFPSWH